MISTQGSEGQGFVYNWTNRAWDDAFTSNNPIDPVSGKRRHGGLLMQVVLQKKES